MKVSSVNVTKLMKKSLMETFIFSVVNDAGEETIFIVIRSSK